MTESEYKAKEDAAEGRDSGVGTMDVLEGEVIDPVSATKKEFMEAMSAIAGIVLIGLSVLLWIMESVEAEERDITDTPCPCKERHVRTPKKLVKHA